MSFVYLAGPIDDVAGSEAKNWRDEAAKPLVEAGLTCYNPYEAFHTDRKIMMGSAGAILSINELAIRVSPYVLVNLSGPGKAIGTIRELDLASRLKKHVVVVMPDTTPRVALHDVSIVVTSVFAATTWIQRHWAENQPARRPSVWQE